MTEMRLLEVPFEMDGKTYKLRCNMNVIADVQDFYKGKFIDALDQQNSARSVIAFLTAMLNDYADDQGWPERFTPKQIGRKFPSLEYIPAAKIMRLVAAAMSTAGMESGEEGPGTPAEENSGN